MAEANCPFCRALPGEAVTATEPQALAHSGHADNAKPEHHKGYWAPDHGVCQCECAFCWASESCICQDCTASDSAHDHSLRRLPVTATSSLTSDGGPS